jgi:anti-sigma factor RsiW
MSHITEDNLLAFALDTLDNPDDASRISAHVRECPECEERLRQIRADLDIIAGIRPQALPALMPRLAVPVFSLRTLARAAALILLGFAAGFATSRFAQHEPAHVTPTYQVWMTADSSTSAPGDATALDAIAF